MLTVQKERLLYTQRKQHKRRPKWEKRWFKLCRKWEEFFTSSFGLSLPLCYTSPTNSS